MSQRFVRQQPVKLPAHRGGTRYEGKDARAILTKASGFMDGYDYTLNPYSGCAFGCTYCYAAFFSRGTETKTGDQRRDDWGNWVEVKENAVALLRRKHAHESLNGTNIYMSTVTDPYQPIERDLRITRKLLCILANHRPKLVVQTRSPDVVRDIDLFKQIAEVPPRDLFSQERGERGRVQVNLTVTTDDEDVRKAFEPSCPSNARRIEAARRLMDGGMDLDDEDGTPVLSTCITMTPLLLVRDPHRFAETLLLTGVHRFIVQPFRLRRGRFVAGTRDAALDKMAERLSCGRHDLVDSYMAHYKKVRNVLRDTLAGKHPVSGKQIRLGEEKEGFEPPF